MVFKIDLLAILGTLKDADIKAPDSYKATIEAFRFDGFNAENIIKKLMALMEKSERVKDVKTRDKEIFDLLSVGLMRGNIKQKSLDATPPAGKVQISELSTTYGINIPRKGDGTKPSGDELTFVRILQVLPHFAAKFVTYGFIPMPTVDTPYWNIQFLPPSMQNTSFSSMLYAFTGEENSPLYRIIRVAHVGWAWCFNETINKEKIRDERNKAIKGKAFQSDYSPKKALTFVDLGITYKLVPKAQARSLLEAYGVCSLDGKVHPSIFAVAQCVLADNPSLDNWDDLSGVELEANLEVKIRALCKNTTGRKFCHIDGSENFVPTPLMGGPKL